MALAFATPTDRVYILQDLNSKITYKNALLEIRETPLQTFKAGK